MFFISTLPTLHCKSYLSHLNSNARRLCFTYRPYRHVHVRHVLSLLLLYFFSGDPERTSYYILTTLSFSLCTRKGIFTQILACHVTRLTGPICVSVKEETNEDLSPVGSPSISQGRLVPSSDYVLTPPSLIDILGHCCPGTECWRIYCSQSCESVWVDSRGVLDWDHSYSGIIIPSARLVW